MSILIGAIVVVIAGGLLISGKARVLVKGFVNLFVEDLAKTEDGAKAIYNEAIDKAQDKYNQANNTLQKVAGQLDTAKRNLAGKEKELDQCDKKCEVYAKQQNLENVKLYAAKREEAIEDIENIKMVINDLLPIFKEAKEINDHNEQQLDKLRKEKTKTLNDLKRNKQLKEMYDSMDELKRTGHVDKLLGSVRDEAKERREQAHGAKVVHNNKTSTKISRADSTAKKMQSDDYAQQLMNKYKK